MAEGEEPAALNAPGDSTGTGRAGAGKGRRRRKPEAAAAPDAVPASGRRRKSSRHLDREEEEESRIALRVAPLDESPEEAAAGDAVTDLTRVAPVNEAADRVKQSRQEESHHESVGLLANNSTGRFS
ncbi:hypothetical protein Q1695_006148 [Nippostrongylus brasiliensis]|nr:hypothetical protein Q1695_006148 [Nippostrongylus brasiliensis]